MPCASEGIDFIAKAIADAEAAVRMGGIASEQSEAKLAPLMANVTMLTYTEKAKNSAHGGVLSGGVLGAARGAIGDMQAPVRTDYAAAAAFCLATALAKLDVRLAMIESNSCIRSSPGTLRVDAATQTDEVHGDCLLPVATHLEARVRTIEKYILDLNAHAESLRRYNTQLLAHSAGMDMPQTLAAPVDIPTYCTEPEAEFKQVSSVLDVPVVEHRQVPPVQEILVTMDVSLESKL